MSNSIEFSNNIFISGHLKSSDDIRNERFEKIYIKCVHGPANTCGICGLELGWAGDRLHPQWHLRLMEFLGILDQVDQDVFI